MSAGIVGMTVIPVLFGKLSEVTGNIQGSYWIAAPCYTLILLYALWGSKLRAKD